jgi:uncharacterized protein (DUF1499 family)
MFKVIKRIVLTVVVLIVLFVALLAGGVMGNALPLNDPPGSFVRLYGYLNFHTAQTDLRSPFPELRTRHYSLSADELFGKVKEAVGRMPSWTVAESNDNSRELHAIVTSKLFRFKDDVNVSVVPEPGGRPLVQIKSVSRVGQGDLGANTRHVMDLYDALEAVGAHGEVERLK